MSLITRFLLAASLSSTLFASLAHGLVTVVMDNGDLISGELVAAQEDNLTIKVDYLGEVSLPTNRVENLDEILGNNEAKEVGPDSAGPAAGASVPAAIEGILEPSLLGYADFLKSMIPFHKWERRLQLGMTSQSGRKDKSDVYYRYNMNVKRENQDLRFNANYYYGKAEEVKTSDKFATDFRWRRNIAPGVFYESSTSYLSDDIKLIDNNLEQKLGLGTRFIENDEMTLSTGVGASGRWREFKNMEEEVIYLVDLFQDWDYRISDRLRLRQDLRFAMPLEESDDYEYNFTASLVSELTEAINLSLRYELGYDNSLDIELREDRRFVSSLGYSF